MRLELLPELYAICQLDQSEDRDISRIWRTTAPFAVIRAADELTLILRQSAAPQDARVEAGYRCFRVAGSLAFDVVGVIAAISSVLSAANIPIFVVSTYNTDYVFVKQEYLDTVISELADHGYNWEI